MNTHFNFLVNIRIVVAIYRLLCLMLYAYIVMLQILLLKSCHYFVTRANSSYGRSRAVPAGTETVCDESCWLDKLGIYCRRRIVV